MTRKKRKAQSKSSALQKVVLSILYLMFLTFRWRISRLPWGFHSCVLFKGTGLYSCHQPSFSQVWSRCSPRARGQSPVYHSPGLEPLPNTLSTFPFLSEHLPGYKTRRRPEVCLSKNPIHTVTASWDMNTGALYTRKLESLVEVRVGHVVSCHSAFICAILSV